MTKSIKCTKLTITCSKEYKNFTFPNPYEKNRGNKEEKKLEEKMKKSLKEPNISKKKETRLNK